MNEQILIELERIRSEIMKFRNNGTDLGLFGVWVLLGLILWRVW